MEEGAAGGLDETFKAVDPAALLATNIILGGNRTAVLAACEHARGLGYNTVALTASLAGEAREVAKVLYGIAHDVRSSGLLAKAPACIVAGGETTVTLKGAGKGGATRSWPWRSSPSLPATSAAGKASISCPPRRMARTAPRTPPALSRPRVLALADAAGLSIAASLADNDSYRFFDAIGQLFKTGPTMTNVCDLQLTLIP